jgi:FtsP/CotA-like multicopper oxidase with cupredoxin domain
MKPYKGAGVFVCACAVLAFTLWGGGKDNRISAQSANPSPDQEPLDPADIPKFAHDLEKPPVFAPTMVTDQQGEVIRHEYTVSVGQTRVQMLPPGFPQTTVLAYGGQVEVPGSQQTEFARTTPGPTFESTRGIPNRVEWVNEINQPHFLPVDPNLHWANPQALNVQDPPFLPFPHGYQNAQYPVPHVTHTHGLVVTGEHDGTAQQWFTPYGQVETGPTYESNVYDMPNEQLPTQLWYHDHVLGVTRQNVYAGLVGNYMIRDPNDPIENQLPDAEYEYPLVIQGRGFFTDGELNFPREGLSPQKWPYWTVATNADTNIVNGKVWPNLDVEPRRYRFRILNAINGNAFYDITFDNDMPFIIIGSDGGFLPEPQVVQSFELGITERADILVDFSEFEPGTEIVMLNGNADPDTLGTIMQFTVQEGTPVEPDPLPDTLLGDLPELTPDAPKRVKTMHTVVDAEGAISVALDGLRFSNPATDYPLVGSTELWELVGAQGLDHVKHIHLLQFQVLDRQPMDIAGYYQEWQRRNGMPHLRTRPVTVDPNDYTTGPPVPPNPYETGWKDSVQTPGNMVTRILVRWDPQEIPSGGSTPGVNQFPIDPTTGPGYIWHCHVLAHEDNEMHRHFKVINAWEPGVDYEPLTVVAHQDVRYKAREAHTSQAGEPPDTRFDLWKRVNNNDGSWQPQIIYAPDDRVTFQGDLYVALEHHQAQAGLEPPNAAQLWDPVPGTACGQLTQFCQGNSDPVAADCLDTGQAGDENMCLGELSSCLPVCQPEPEPSPCASLCADPVALDVPDGSSFQSGDLGTGATCHETISEIFTGQRSSADEDR